MIVRMENFVYFPTSDIFYVKKILKFFFSMFRIGGIYDIWFIWLTLIEMGFLNSPFSTGYGFLIEWYILYSCRGCPAC